MPRYVVVIALMLALAVPVSAQRLNLDFPGLEERAEEVVDITLDAAMLRLAGKFFSGDKGDEREIREMLSGLQGIYVRSYTFAKEGEYDRRLVDRVKSQLGATWKPLVTVRSKTRDNVNIMADTRGDRINGLVIIAADPREFTVVNIVGNIDLDRLSRLEGEFGIPRITKEGRNE